MGVFSRAPEPLPAGVERAEALPFNAPRPLVAAAARMKITDRGELEQLKKRKGATSAWQSEAWEYYDSIGEIKYAFMLVAALMSRMRLHVAYVAEPSDPPSTLSDVPALDEDVVALAHNQLNRLQSCHGGIPGMIADASINLSVAGECYLVQQLPSIDGTVPEKWTIRSIDEVQVDNNGKISVQTARSMGTQGIKPLESSAFVGRIWRPHARFHDEADSSMRALLQLCEELLLLNRTVRATAKSRLNAGALFVPDGLSVAAAPDVVNEDGSFEEDADSFEAELMAAMTTPIADEESASAVVPLLIRGPGELGSQIRHFSFERSFDAALAERADRVLERILQGVDVPKDVVTGLANVKYSNAVQINQTMYRGHIEPMTLLLCDALTAMFMRPALIAKGVDPDIAEKIVVWYDPSDILTSADRAQSASDGWDRYLLSGSAWRSAHGFAETDAPSGDELIKRITVSRGQIAGEFAESVYQRIAPDLLGEVREQNIAGAKTPMPENLQSLLETGQMPAPGEGAAPLPPEVLEGLPLPEVGQGPAAPEPEEVPEEEAPPQQPEQLRKRIPTDTSIPMPDEYGLRRVR
jgi:hypothetical protein